MGIEYSTEAHQDLPVTGRFKGLSVINHHGLQAVNCLGAPKSLDVLKHSGKYIKKDIVILQLRENGLNYRWWSEANTNKYSHFLQIHRIVDTEGETYFEIQSTELMDGSIKMLDHKGKTIACARKERFGPGKTANIIVKNGINKFLYSPILNIKSKQITKMYSYSCTVCFILMQSSTILLKNIFGCRITEEI